MKIGEAITTMRKKRGMTSKALAAKAKISTTYLSNIERGKGKANPTTATIEAIAAALDVPAEVMLFMALNRDDVAPAKRAFYDSIAPSMNEMIAGAFINTDPKP